MGRLRDGYIGRVSRDRRFVAAQWVVEAETATPYLVGFTPKMALTTPLVRDWSYRGAQRRLRRAARALLPRHTGNVRLDDAGNRVVDCACGWTGNGLGWLTHLDQVVSSVLRD